MVISFYSVICSHPNSICNVCLWSLNFYYPSYIALFYFIFFAINFSLTLGILVFDSHCSCDFHTPLVFYSFLPCCPLPLKHVLLIACLRSLLCQSSIIVRYIYIHTLYSRTTILPPVLHVCAMLAYFE